MGRTGAEGAWVLVGESPRQEAPVAHVRPFWQQPPPRLAAQENQPVEQTYEDAGVEVVAEVVAEVEVEVEVGVFVVVGDVGTTMTAVEEGGAAEEVDGCTKVVDVPWKTPK